MKKLISVLIAAVMVLTFSFGCSMSAFAEDTPVTGGWEKAASPEITSEVKTVCDKAQEDYVGCEFAPVALLETQVVSGTNYKVLCRATPVVEYPTETYAIVTFYEDLEGNATITDVDDTCCETNISDNDSDTMEDGWYKQAKTPVMNDENQAAFDKLHEYIGNATPCEAVALLAYQQRSDMMDYCFLVRITATGEYGFVEGEIDTSDGTVWDGYILTVKEYQIASFKVGLEIEKVTSKVTGTAAKKNAKAKITAKKNASADYYQFQYKKSGGKYSAITKSVSNVKTYKLKKKGTYYVRVRAVGTMSDGTVVRGDWVTKKVTVK